MKYSKVLTASAALAALAIPRERCRSEALRYTWAESARQFYDNIAQAHGSTSVRVRAAGTPSRGIVELG